MVVQKLNTTQYTPTFIFTAGIGTASPIDATTYFNISPGFSGGGAAGQARIYMPIAGTITACYVSAYTFGTVGTNETSTLSLRLNNTTDTVVSSAIVLSANTTNYSNTSMGVAVAVGDYIEFKLLTPTWATNPGSISLFITARIN